MKKVLLAVDGDNFPEGAFEFARKMNEQEPILLTGVFLPELDLSRNITYASVFVPLLETYAAESLEKSIATFRQQCMRYGIDYNIHNNLPEYGIPELKKETRFADLLLLGHEKFYGDLSIYGTEEFLGGALHNAECPVIAVPEKFSFPESIILTYDGGSSAAHAIKSFAYLFPQLCDRKAILIYSTAIEREMPEMEKIKELAGHHFSNLEFQVLNADPKKYFGTWLDNIKHPIVVSGSYNRTGVSRTFKHSFISEIMREHKVPVYIAHL
ncbi:hypothetical protein [Chitinophaga sp.]|uniref:hypothetical protein n=1 Tax=Chitinophaga sp. TaxID=1869181 RepID=UPI002F928CA1